MIYEYECIKCGKEIEIQKPMARCKNAERCYRCGHTLERVMSTPYVIGTEGRDWDNAGFSDPMQSSAIDSDTKAGIKRKIDKCTNFDTGKRKQIVV